MLDAIDGKFYVTDLASTNGTWVDGVDLEPGKPTLLSAGSEVVFGDEHLCKFALEEISDAEIGL